MSLIPVLPRVFIVAVAILAVAFAGCSSGSGDASPTAVPDATADIPSPIEEDTTSPEVITQHTPEVIQQNDPVDPTPQNTPDELQQPELIDPTPQNSPETAGIIIDHRTTHLDQIPTKWITEAKNSLHIAYGHTSHGSQLISGMNGLMNWKGDLYAWDDEGGMNGALDIDDYAFSSDPHDLGSNGDLRWERLTRAYLDDPANSDTNVIMWAWCGGVSGSSQQDIDTYLNTMSQLEADYPNVMFVYMTGHSDGTGLAGSLHIRNQQIRNYCIENNKVLYDFYDIECYDPDGNYFGDKLVNDNCDYDSDGNGSRDANWAQQWQDLHVKGVDWYACYAAHSQPLNANQKAYAAWWLWARLAGWDGESTS